MLTPAFEAAQEARACPDLRIIVLSDGSNNTGKSAQAALDAANRIGAVVDGIADNNSEDHVVGRVLVTDKTMQRFVAFNGPL